MADRGARYPGPIPNRWLKCPRKSQTLVGEKFLVCKTPLDHRFDEQVPEEYRFPVDFIFMSMGSYKVKIGMWIDLTNTNRFYNRNDVEKAHPECRYIKLQCKGRDETPTAEQTKLFVEVVDRFIRQHPLEVIVVHCTHGFNRSGFLISSYLIEKWDWELRVAVAEFAKARPPGIYKQDYLNELLKRYGDADEKLVAPLLPEWCREEQESEDEPQQQQRRSIKRKRRGTEIDKEDATFMDGAVPGVELVPKPLCRQIQVEVQQLCAWQNSGFPGCQPVSMDRQNITLLEKKPYMVSWKADGTRYLMYIKQQGEVFCLDRDNCVFRIPNLTFPFKKNLMVHIKDTLLDGEMVIDRVSGQNVPRFLIYDAVSIMKQPVRNYPFDDCRYKAILNEIVEPRTEAMKRGLIQKESEPFSVRRKEFWDVRDAGKILGEKFSRQLSHEPDGLIFQPAKDPYVVGRCPEVLKWKPPSLNSVDFRLKITVDTRPGAVRKKIGQLFVGKLDQPFDYLSSLKNVQHLDGKIIECRYENGKWIFMRERTDKSYPNSFDTVQGVCRSIIDPVTKEILLDFIERHPYLPPPTSLPVWSKH